MWIKFTYLMCLEFLISLTCFITQGHTFCIIIILTRIKWNKHKKTESIPGWVLYISGTFSPNLWPSVWPARCMLHQCYHLCNALSYAAHNSDMLSISSSPPCAIFMMSNEQVFVVLLFALFKTLFLLLVKTHLCSTGTVWEVMSLLISKSYRNTSVYHA